MSNVHCSISNLHAAVNDGSTLLTAFASKKELSEAADHLQCLSAENLALRYLLAQTAGRFPLYLDDGEIQDNAVFPCIDFLRDTPDKIRAKLKVRLDDDARSERHENIQPQGTT